MLLHIVKRDFQRNKIITTILFFFIMLSALLIASASHVITELSSSLNNLLSQSKAPHFVQMHAGPIDKRGIEEFARAHPLVKEQQTVEMLRIDGSNVFIGSSEQSEANSVMDIGFVRQNVSFDLLLNLKNQVIQVAPGEIAMPIYYMQQKSLELGDTVLIQTERFKREFKIVDFVRDAQMNPAMVSSKRFVISEKDFAVLRENVGDMEYLIEFLLTDLSKLSDFSSNYFSSNMPNKGPTIDYSLFTLLNALTDGMIAIVIIIVSFLLMVIALLCLRLTITATMEEDYQEIGVMKAIGLSNLDIKRIYLAKYIVISALATSCGYLISLTTINLVTANISLYLGAVTKSLLSYVIPFLAVGLIFCIVVFFCKVMLRRLNRISAVESLRSGTSLKSQNPIGRAQLSRCKYVNVNVFLGIKDVFRRVTMFTLLFFVYALNVFIIMVPLGLLHTLQLPSFISYLGVGQSDIRIDLPQSANTQQRFSQIITALDNDPDIEKFSPLITSRYQVQNDEGVWESVNVETGDFSIFPLSYISGSAPKGSHELVLSDLLAKDLNKKVNDTLVIKMGEVQVKMRVSGTYQDITNGGRTAKAQIPYDSKNVMWHVIALDVKPDVSVHKKVDQFTDAFYPAKITHLKSYLAQTLGNTIRQLQFVTILAIVISLSITVLITSLFLRMLLAKDAPQLAMMRSLGFTIRDIQIQYLIRMLLLGGTGVIIGTLGTVTIGQGLIQVVGSFMGAPKIHLEFNSLITYVLYPLLFLAMISITSLLNTRAKKKYSIAEHISK
ncbi:ABC transporter permease [Paenibacillus sp. J45TS6]|uniref:ABC transporter permease n=2 Tax=unclassified Paenibacillus TaxID=185978 RepID=UPI001B0349CE|nr:FtsX-like permease family protein [Paenibacillus sp. J45TS6]GIP42901.1 ABC transporter permease [Paenibacillus sp. J45TS6]